jgi:two-component system OmpR family sensor kinase
VTETVDAGAGAEDFVAMAAHELRGAATVIAGAAETLGQLVDTDELHPRASELLTMLVRHGRHMQKLAADVLSSVYLERGDLPLTMTSVPLLPIIGWAVDASGPAEPAVRVECDPGLSANVDADHLERIVTNLVSNALEHGSAPVVVSARPLAKGDGATVAVRDFGKGVAPNDADRLFDRFSPLAAHTSTSTGLGLAIARGLARAMGGDLTYQPADPGSLFSLTLTAA